MAILEEDKRMDNWMMEKEAQYASAGSKVIEIFTQGVRLGRKASEVRGS